MADATDAETPAATVGLASAAAQQGCQWQDVTQLVKQACADMAPGQMIMPAEMTLWDAMIAMQIGDPKMDAGRASVPKSIEQGQRDKWLPETLDLPTQLAVMDKLLAAEISWHQGNLYAQTIYTCIYTQHYGALRDSAPALHAYILALLRSVDVQRSIISRADIYNEEDYNPDMLRVDLAFNTTTQDLLTLLDAAEAAMRIAEATSPEPAVAVAVRQRLAYRRAIYLLSLALDSSQPDLSAAVTLTMTAQELLTAVVASMHLGGMRVPGFLPAFSALLQTTTAPRAEAIMFVQQAMTRAEAQLSGIKKLFDLTGITTLPALLHWVDEFASIGADLWIRSAAYVACSWRGHLLGKHAHCSMIVDDVTSRLLVPGKVLQPDASDSAGTAAVQAFLAKAEAKLDIYISVMCRNRTRQHRMLANITEDLAELGDLARAVDHAALLAEAQARSAGRAPSLPAGPELVMRWVSDLTCRCETTYLLLGFPLDLYMKDEFAGIWFYLVYLTRSRRHTLTRAREQYYDLVQAAGAARAAAAAAAGGGNRKKAKQKGGKVGKDAGRTSPSFDERMAEIHAFLASGLMHMLLGLRMHGLWPATSYPFGSAELRFEKRMAAFQRCSQPAPIGYSYLEADVAKCLGPDAVPQSEYDSAGRLLQGASSALQELKAELGDKASASDAAMLMGLLKVVYGNLVCLRVLGSMPDSPSDTRYPEISGARATTPVQADWSKNDVFPVITIKRSDG